MRRRDFLGILSGVAVAAAPLFARAQQNGKIYRVAIVVPQGSVSDMSETASIPLGAFLRRLRQLGYIEGQNLVVERASAEGRPEDYAQMVVDVVRNQPDAVLANGIGIAREFKAQTTSIPIVILTPDPVAIGIVSNVARPGGNVTGVYAAREISGKRLALLKEAVPTLSRVGVLTARTLIAHYDAAMLKEASEAQGISLVGSPFESPFNEAAYRHACAAIAQAGAEAVYVADQWENWINRELIVEVVRELRLPAIYPTREAVRIGGFMAYEIDYSDMFAHAADTVGQILEGSKAGDIPFYQAQKFELVINLKTAKALGIDISPNLLAQADEVIE